MSGWDPGGDRAARRCCRRPRAGPRREGIFALWLTVRVAQDLLRDPPPAERAHRRRLQALEHRLSSLTLPPPLRRALAAAMSQLKEARPETAAQVLSQLVAPAREAGRRRGRRGAGAGRPRRAARRSARRALAWRRDPEQSVARGRWSRGSTRSPAGSAGARHRAERLPLARPDARRRPPAAGPGRPGRRRRQREVGAGPRPSRSGRRGPACPRCTSRAR